MPLMRVLETNMNRGKSLILFSICGRSNSEILMLMVCYPFTALDSFFITTDGIGVSVTAKRERNQNLGVPREPFLKTARTNHQLTDWNNFNRGICFLDNGIVNLDLTGEHVLGIDPGHAHPVRYVDADVEQLIINNPNVPPSQLLQQHFKTGKERGGCPRR